MVLRTATRDENVRRDRGRIAPGFRAQLLLLNGDPTEDITVARNISKKWLSRAPVDRAELLQTIKAIQPE